MAATQSPYEVASEKGGGRQVWRIVDTRTGKYVGREYLRRKAAEDSASERNRKSAEGVEW